MNKIKIKCDEKQYIYKILQYLPHKILLNYKGGKGNFTVEKPGRHKLTQLTKLRITNNGTHQNCEAPPDGMQ